VTDRDRSPTRGPAHALRAVVSVWLICALASPAWAAPAVVRVFEAQAHEQPDEDSPVLHVFPEDAKLSVSEEVTDGWRRVRLPDGRTGFVRDDQLAGAATAPVQPLPRTNPPAARTQVRDLPSVESARDVDHLLALTQGDAVVGPQANALVLRRTASIAIMVGAAAAAIAVGIASVTVLAHKECGDPPFESDCVTSPSFAALTIAPLLAVGGVLTWLWLKPSRSDVREVIDAWNARHREQLLRYAR
jgi:hypothetical protein